MRILVVEDERTLAQVLASALQAEHYEVVVAAFRMLLPLGISEAPPRGGM